MSEFNYNDFITLTIDDKRYNHIVNDDSDISGSVSLYFVNTACKRNIIKKWIPQIGEECFFYNENNEFVIDFFNGLEINEFDNTKYFISSKNHIMKNPFFNNKNIFEFCGSIEEEFIENNTFKYCEPYIGQTIPFLLTKNN